MMADYDINNPNDYVPEPAGSLPPSAIGKGGLSAIGIAARGSLAQPRPAGIAGGLASDNGQLDLESLLFPRVRDSSQLADAKANRQGGLTKLQAALAMPENTMSGIENIARGMAGNDHPWDVGYGFRQGVAGAMDANAARTKLARDSAIQSAQAQMGLDKNEEAIDTKTEDTALNDLTRLAKPIRTGAGGAGGQGGVRFKSVPGTGLVDTWTVDEQGVPKVVYGDGKVLSDARMKARKIAEAEAESQQNNLTFKSDADRQNFIQQRTDQIVGGVLTGTFPGKMNNGEPIPVGAAKPGVPGAPPKFDNPTPPALLDGLKATESGGDPLAFNKDSNTMGAYQFKPATVQMLHKMGIKFNPFDEKEARDAADKYLQILQQQNGGDMKKALAAYGGHITVDPTAYINKVTQNAQASLDPDIFNPDGSRRIAGPEEQRGRIKTAEEVAKNQGEAVSGLKANAETGMNMKSTVDELRQLKFDPGLFAKWKQRGGNIMEALGEKGPLAKMAAESGNAESLLQALSNARISLEKGVQTRDDEVRFKAELAKITDPRDAYDYMLKHMKELGQKSIDHYNYVESWRRDHGGNSYDGSDQAWQKRNDELGGMVKRYQGTFVGRSDFINHMVTDPDNLKAYNGDTAKLNARAEKEWRALGSK